MDAAMLLEHRRRLNCAKSRRYYHAHKMLCKEKHRVYCQKNKERMAEYYRMQHKKRYNGAGRDRIIAKVKAWALAHPERVRDRVRKWERAHPEKRREYWARQYHGQYKLRATLRHRVRMALRQQHSLKTGKTVELLGCTIQELMVHLERQFQPGMSWGNYGKWHVDHIKPCAGFNLIDIAEQQNCFHYTNLQPLWAIDNIIKSNKVS